MKKIISLVMLLFCCVLIVQAQTTRSVVGPITINGTTVSGGGTITGNAFAAGDHLIVTSGTLTLSSTAATTVGNLTLNGGNVSITGSTVSVPTTIASLTITSGAFTSNSTGSITTISGNVSFAGGTCALQTAPSATAYTVVNGTVTGSTTGSTGRLMLGTGAVIDGTSTAVNLQGVELQNFGTSAVIKGNCTLGGVIRAGSNSAGNATCAYTLGATGVTSTISMSLSGSSATKTFTYAGTNTTISISSGTLISAASQTIPNLTITGSTTIGNSVTVSNLRLNSGVLTVASAQTLTIASGGSITRTAGSVTATGTFSVPSTGISLTYSNTGAITTSNELPATSVANLTINGSNTVTLGANVAVTSTLTLTSGTLATAAAKTVTINSGATVSRATGVITTTAQAAVFGANIHVTYTGSTGVTTGSELPTSLGNGTLTINNSGGVTLASSTTANTFTLTSGKLTLSTFNLTTSAITGSSSVGNFNSSNSNYVDASNSGRLAFVGMTNATTVLPIGTSNSFTPITFSGTSAGSPTITVGMGTASNLGATQADLLALQWYVRSSASSITSNVTYQFNSSNIANSFSETNTNDLAVTSGGSSLSIASSNLSIGTPTPFTTMVSGLAIPSTVSEYFVIGKQGSILTASTITFGTLSGITANTVCAGTSGITLTYTVGGSFTGGNVFSAQLSDASGSFSSPVSLGTLNSTGSGTINITIPPGTTPGTGYRIRISSSTPSVQSSDNGTNITINNTTWQGANGADANVAGNWCGGLPTAASNIIINNSTTPAMSDNLTVASAAIGSGSGLTIGSNTFTVSGAMTGAGTITGSASSSLSVGSGSSINMNTTTLGITNALSALTVSGATSTSLTTDAVVTALTLSATANSNLVVSANKTLKLVGSTFGFTASGGRVDASASGAFFEIAHSSGTVTLPAACLTTTTNVMLSNTTSAPVNITGTNTINNLTFTSGSYLLMNTSGNVTAVTLTVNGILTGSGAYEINTGAAAGSKILLSNTGASTVNNFTQQAGPLAAAAGINYLGNLTFSGTNSFSGAGTFSNNAIITLNNTTTTYSIGFTLGSASRLFKSDGLSTLIFGAGISTLGSLYLDQTIPGTTNRLASLQMTGNANVRLDVYNNLIVGTLSLGNTNTNAGIKLNQATAGATTKLTITGNSFTNSGAAIDATIGGTSVELANTATFALPNKFVLTGSKVILNNSAAATLAAALSLDSLTLTNGTLNDGGFTLTITNRVVGGSGTHTGSGKMLVTATSGIIGTGNYGNLEIAPGAGNTVSVATSSTPTINGTLTLTSGSFAVGANTININGAISGTAISTTSASSITFGGSSATFSIPSTITSLNNLTLNNSASGVYSLSQSLTLAGTLTLTKGVLKLGSRNVVAASLANNTSASNFDLTKYIDARGGGQFTIPVVTATTYVFPMGTATTYNPVSFSSLSGSTNLSVGVDTSTITGLTPANLASLKWNINTSTASITSNVTFQFLSTNVALGFDASQATVSFAKSVNAILSEGVFTSVSGTGGSGSPYVDVVNGVTLSSINGDYFLVGNSGSLVAPSISLGTLTGFTSNTACAGSTGITLPFTASGVFASGTTFNAQLSASDGTFNSATIVGSLSTDGVDPSGTINISIPAGTTAASLYRIRIVSTGTSATSANNGTNLTINNTTWTGANGADANVAGNWCGGVPTASSIVLVSTTSPKLTANLTVSSLTLNSGIDLNGRTLTVTGTYAGSGTIKGSATSGLSVGAASLNFDITTPGTTNVLGNLTTSGAVTLNQNLFTGALAMGGNLSLAAGTTLSFTSGSAFTRTSGVISAPTAGGATVQVKTGSFNDTLFIPTGAFTSTASNLINLIIDGSSAGFNNASTSATVQNLTFTNNGLFTSGQAASNVKLFVAGTLSGTGQLIIGAVGNQRILLNNNANVTNLTLTAVKGSPSLGATDAANANVNFTGTNTLTGVGFTLAAGANSFTQRIVLAANSITSIGGLAGSAATTKTVSGSSSAKLALTAASTIFMTSGSASLDTLSISASTTLSNALAVNGLNLYGGTFTTGGFLTLNSGAIVNRTAGSISATPVGSSYHVVYPSHTASVTTGNELPSTTTVLQNLSIANSNGVTLGSAVTVNGTLNLQSGAFTAGTNLTMASNSTIARSAGTITGTIAGSAYNVLYNGSTAVTTSTELPATITGSLTISNAAGVTLAANRTVGSVQLTTGKLTLGAFNLTTGGISGGSSSSYIATSGNGNLIYTALGASAATLPIGTSTVYAPLIFTGTTNTPTLTVSAAPLGLGVANSANVVQLQWDIQSDRASSATIGYQYNASNFTSFNPAGSVEIDGYVSSFTTYSTSGTTGSDPYVTSSASSFALPTTNTTFVIGTTGSVISASTLTVGTISTSPICPLSTINVPYTVTGSYTVGNVFTAQLSNASGSFSNGVQTLGTLTSTTSGTIVGIIPRGTTSGSSYKVRVVSSLPGVTSAASTNSVNVSSNTGTYTGANGGDANVDANWCGGVPSSSDNIVINSNAPKLSANLTVLNVTLNGGIDLNGFTFTAGTISGNGSITASNGSLSAAGGTVRFNQSNNSLTNFTTTGAVSLANSVNVGALELGGNLTLTTGTLNITSSFTRNSGIIQAATAGSGTIRLSNTSGTITLTATSLPTTAGTNYPNIVLNNSGGSSVVLGASPASGTVSNYIQNLTFNAGSSLLLGGGTANSTVLRTFGTITGSGSYTANAGAGAATRILAENGSIINNLVLTGGGAFAASGAAFTISGTTSFGRLEMLASAATSSTSLITLSGNITLDSISNENANRKFVSTAATNLTFNQGFTNGKLYFSQTSSQNYLNNLTTNGSFTLGNALNLTGILKVNSGTLNIGTNLLTLKSTSIANSAIVDQVGGAISGTATVERYIPKGFRAWRDMAPSVFNAGSIFNNWQEGGSYANNGYGLFITGTTATTNAHGVDATTGLDQTINSVKSAYTFTNGTWNAVTNTKTTNLNPFLGYRLLVRGDRSFNLYTTPISTVGTTGWLLMNAATALRTRGNLITGNVVYATSGITNTVTGSTYNSASFGLNSSSTTGFSSVANPYVAPIDWKNIWDNNRAVNLTANYYYLDPTIGSSGAYVSYNAITDATSNGAIGSRRYIQAGQAFFVENNNSIAPSLTITEADKAIGSTKTAVFGNTNRSRLTISLMKSTGAELKQMDGATVVFDPSYSNGFGQEDAKKMTNPGENLAINHNGQTFSIEGRQPASAEEILPLSLSQLANCEYQLTLDASAYNVVNQNVYLNDAFNNSETLLSSTVNNISFTVDSSNPATYTNRFSVVFKAANKAATAVAPVVASTISVYPNPLVGKTISVRLGGEATVGKYVVNVYNYLGQQIHSSVYNYAGSVLNCKLPQALAKGGYQLTVLQEGNVVGESKIVVE